MISAKYETLRAGLLDAKPPALIGVSVADNEVWYAVKKDSHEAIGYRVGYPNHRVGGCVAWI